MERSRREDINEMFCSYFDNTLNLTPPLLWLTVSIIQGYLESAEWESLPHYLSLAA